MNTIKISFILFAFIGSSLMISCGSKTTEEAATEDHHEEEENTVEFTAAQYKTAGIELGKVENKQISGTIK